LGHTLFRVHAARPRSGPSCVRRHVVLIAARRACVLGNRAVARAAESCPPRFSRVAGAVAQLMPRAP
jgi:hypothetical protein